ncbi:MAG: hypothetical protein IJ397_07470 [Lachnospiraceae bacterium]|nr:hypothetical protein [Lachnospiraceae bacterium]
MNENDMYGTVSETIIKEENNTTEQMPGSGLAMASFICGIVSAVALGWIGPTIWVAIICGIVGGKKYPSYTSEYKKCKWGIGLGIFAFVIGTIQGLILGFFMIFWPVLYLNS